MVDTSVLMAVLLGEPSAADCAEILASRQVMISATTLAEALVVADRRGLRNEMTSLIDGMGVDVVDVSAATARRVADTYARWGKGVHGAALNFGDCFAYDLATINDCPLLYVGKDFGRTDVTPALRAPAGR